MWSSTGVCQSRGCVLKENIFPFSQILSIVNSFWVRGGTWFSLHLLWDFAWIEFAQVLSMLPQLPWVCVLLLWNVQKTPFVYSHLSPMAPTFFLLPLHNDAWALWYVCDTNLFFRDEHSLVCNSLHLSQLWVNTIYYNRNLLGWVLIYMHSDDLNDWFSSLSI